MVRLILGSLLIFCGAFNVGSGDVSSGAACLVAGGILFYFGYRSWTKGKAETYDEPYVHEELTSFSDTINSIPESAIILSDIKVKRHKLSELPDFRSTNITKASNRDALGSFIAIDTETTGLSPWNDRIIELSAVRYIDWKPFDRFTTLINPERPIPERASEINGITDDMVADAPTISQVIPAFQQYLGKYNLVGHNVTFDLKFLFASGLDLQPAPSRKIYDTLPLSRRVLEKDVQVSDYKLQTLCDYYGIRPERYAHRSMSDCLATAQLFTIIADQKMWT